MRAVDNPPNPFVRAELEWDGPAPPARLELFEEECKEALSENRSPDIGFRWSLNPYRGCFHACAYCYARPTHQYLSLGAGTDFDRKIVVKTNVVERLRAAFERPRWRGQAVVLSGNTDCYQPIEASYRLTRGCLEVCREYGNPVAVITKGTLVRRDVDVLAELAARDLSHVTLSIPFADDAMARAIEPFASPPSKRFATLRMLSEADIPTTVSLGPVIPGLNDDQLPEILERAADAGARSAFLILLRLPAEVREIFLKRLHEAFPLRAKKVVSQLTQIRGAELRDARFHLRMAGEGPRWEIIRQTFALHLRRVGLAERSTELDLLAESPHFRRPDPSERPGGQLSLF